VRVPIRAPRVVQNPPLAAPSGCPVDVRWILPDSASVDLLAHLCRHTRPDRVVLVGSYRDVEVGPEHSLRKTVRELARELLVEKVEVRRSGREETAALISARLNGAEVPKEFSGLVVDHT
jgi:predicted ATPase